MSWNRIVNIKIATKTNEPILDIQNELKIDFEIEKTKDKTANYCKLNIYNLSKNLFDKLNLNKKNKLNVQLGYEDEFIENVFFGDLVKWNWEKEGTESNTELEALEGLIKLTEIAGSYSFNENVSSDVILNKLISDLGFTKGNKVLKTIEYKNGYSYIGYTKEALKEILDDLGWDYFVDGNYIYFFEKNKKENITKQIQILDFDSGLIKYEFVEDKENERLDNTKKQIKITAFINPRLKVGDLLTLVDENKNKYNVLINKLKFTGTNWGGDFFVEIEGEV